MPAIAADVQKRFKLTIADGLPQATIEIAGNAQWVRCCPLCGCIHQIITADVDAPYTPICQTMPVLYKTQQTSWVKLYPDVSPYTTLRLLRETRT